MRLTTHPIRYTLLACLAAVALVALANSQAQSDRPPWARKNKSDSAVAAPGTTTPPAATSVPAADSEASNQRNKIRVSVNLVSILASVLDENNRPATDIPRDSFQVFEEGVLQKIEVFESETQQPLDLALMIDASLSAHKEIAFEQDAAAHFIKQVLRPGDRLSVFSVSEDVTQLASYSDNVPALQAAVHHIPAGAGTSIYDALLLGSHTLERRGSD